MIKFYLGGLLSLLLLISYPAQALEEGTLFLTSTHGGDGSAWRQTQCDGCHLLNRIHQQRGRSVQTIVRRKGYESCTGCHGRNGTDLKKPCILCHNPQDLPTAPTLTGAENHNFIVGQVNGLTDEQCISCHQASNMNGQFELNVDLTAFPDANGRNEDYSRITDFCLRCHNLDHQQPGYEILNKNFRDPLVAMEKNYNFLDMHGYPKGSGQRTYFGLVPNYRYASVVECTDCHAMHGTHNPKLIIDSASKGATQLADPTDYPVNVINGDYSQLCVLCHRMQNPVEDGRLDTGNGLSGVHLTGADEDCRQCHTHGQAVQVGL
ncbi:MAG: cytochrome c3 family protein [Methylococcales bacterium]|nr:cytochrome c3 family protein [Methylococcales bacterium]